MSKIKELGSPNTVGQLKEVLSNYPNATSFGFINQPMQELVEVNSDNESFVVFQVLPVKDDIVKISFKDAPVGARFRYPNNDKIWVKINSYPKGQFHNGDGLVCQWNGNVVGHQSFCTFVDKENEIDFETIIELV